MDKYLKLWEIVEDAKSLQLYGAQGSFNLEQFNSLSDNKKNEISKLISHVFQTGENVHFSANDFNSNRKIQDIFKRHERYSGTSAKNSKIKRTRNLNVFSKGIHTIEDIRQIYRIQKGYCYYTGEAISFNPRTFSIDHIKPVFEGGSSWPSNIALCLKSINSQKRVKSKQRFLNHLEKERGQDWRKQRNEIIKLIDKERKVIDKARKLAVSIDIKAINEKLKSIHPDSIINYHLTRSSDVCLVVDDIEVNFPAGFLRRSKSTNDREYIENLVTKLLDK